MIVKPVFVTGLEKISAFSLAFLDVSKGV